LENDERVTRLSGHTLVSKVALPKKKREETKKRLTDNGPVAEVPRLKKEERAKERASGATIAKHDEEAGARDSKRASEATNAENDEEAGARDSKRANEATNAENDEEAGARDSKRRERRGSRVAVLRERTNAPTSSTSRPSCPCSSTRRTMALPTITPSAASATRAASSGVATPNPTATGVFVCFLIFATLSRTPAISFSLAPVMPVRET